MDAVLRNTLCAGVSAVSVVPIQGYLAYVCTSIPDTVSSVVGIPRGILTVSGIFAPRQRRCSPGNTTVRRDTRSPIPQTSKIPASEPVRIADDHDRHARVRSRHTPALWTSSIVLNRATPPHTRYSKTCAPHPTGASIRCSRCGAQSPADTGALHIQRLLQPSLPIDGVEDEHIDDSADTENAEYPAFAPPCRVRGSARDLAEREPSLADAFTFSDGSNRRPYPSMMKTQTGMPRS